VRFTTRSFGCGTIFGIVTAYWLDDRGIGVRVPIGSRIFTSPYRQDWLWGPGDKAAGA
jgi:hypothetical protein